MFDPLHVSFETSMKNRRGAKANGRDRRDLYYEMEFMGQLPPPLPRRRRQFTKVLTSPILAFGVLGAIVGFAVMVAMQDIHLSDHTSVGVEKSEPFRWAVNRAISAADLTQRAQSAQEWQAVATWWQEAIALMRQVPTSYERYDVAQSRIADYERNLQYARRKAQESSQSLVIDTLWSIGSRRTQVIAIQGEPSSIDRQDTLCKEVLRYGGSLVELRNGVVVGYEDGDRNLRITPKLPQPVSGRDSHWSLGSTKEEVFNLQGTPTRVARYDSSRQEFLYYGNSSIELTNNRVTGYSNFDENLRVQTLPIGKTSDRPYWSLDSTREDLFRVQGTPTQIEVDNITCSETLSYGNSSVDLKNGFITGYNNLDNNLKVKVKE